MEKKPFITSGPGPGLENRTVFIIIEIRTLILNLSYVVAEWSKTLSCNPTARCDQYLLGPLVQ